MSITGLKRELKAVADAGKARDLQRFFKTGPGEYGEGDIFIGVTVPAQRRVARRFRDLPVGEVESILHSDIHEERLVALLILVERFRKNQGSDRERIYRLYLANTRFINNWDLVDLSAPRIVGAFLADRSRAVLHDLALSDSLWERRIAVLSTFYFIKDNDFDDSLAIADTLLRDKHDLIHKAVGWMLREIGKRDLGVEERFLREHYREMPRTMLRYAIERFPETKRQRYLKGRIRPVTGPTHRS